MILTAVPWPGQFCEPVNYSCAFALADTDILLQMSDDELFHSLFVNHLQAPLVGIQPRVLHPLKQPTVLVTGPRRFARIRSDISTVRKHGIKPMTVLRDLFDGRPWMLPETS